VNTDNRHPGQGDSVELGDLAGKGVVVGNEFASIEISVVDNGRGRQVVLRDVASGQARRIDPLVLEALVFMSDEAMRALADPNLIVTE
jgi:hypothetical protein